MHPPALRPSQHTHRSHAERRRTLNSQFPRQQSKKWSEHQALRQIEQAYRDNTLYSENFKLDSIAEQVLLEYFSDDDPSFRNWIDGADLA